MSLLPQLETTRHEPQISSRSDWLMIEGDCCICQSERSFFDVCHIILFPSPGTFDWLADNYFVLIVMEVGGYAEFEIFSPPRGFIMAAASQPRPLARLLVGNKFVM